MDFPTVRMRRLRRNETIRAMVRENTLDAADLIYPLFVKPGTGKRDEVSSMPGVFQISVDQLEAEAAGLKALGIPAVILFGLPETKDEAGSGAYDPDGGYADPALAANSFADAAKRLGVELVQRTSVTALRVEDARIAGVRTDKGDIASPTVINAAGPWGARLAAQAGVEIPITVTRHPVVVMQRPPAWRNPTPVWGDLIGGWYFKPDGGSAIMVGSVQDDHRSVDPDRYVDTANEDEIVAASSAILRRFPVMEEGTARRSWAGIYDVTPDSQPVIDRIERVPGLFCAFGFSGHGFKIAPAVGRIVSDLVLDGRCRSYDIHIFRHDRFRTGELHPSGYKYSIVG